MAETKKCSYCQVDIPGEASICPNCKSDLRSWFRRHPILTILLGLFILGLFAPPPEDGGRSTSPASSGTEVITQPEPEEVEYTVGQLIKSKSFEITITKVEERDIVGGQHFNSQPAEGGTYVAVQFKYKNISDKPQGMFSTPTIQLLDSSSVEYSADIGASSSYATELELDRKIISDLNPGITVNGAKIFEIGKEQYRAGGWKIQVKADREDYIVKI